MPTTKPAREPASAARGVPDALRNRRFRLVWLGETVSQVGDQFYFISLPLFVFMITGSAAQLGLVLLIEGVPRAVLTLFGGALSDRISPHRVMLLSNGARTVITAALALLIFTHTLQIWMVYAVAFCFGAVDAFFQPAFMSFIPATVAAEDLQASNSLAQGSNQVTQAIGPGLAGLVVSTVGVAGAVFLDALTFLFTTVMLLQARPPANAAPEERRSAPGARAIVREISAMVDYVRRDAVLRPYVPLLLTINLALVGPISVGPAVLAQLHPDAAALVLGVLVSALGAGAVLGTLAASRLVVRRFGRVFLSAVALNGLCLIAIGAQPPLLLLALAIGLIGVSLGYTNVLLLTWFGQQVPPTMMGRFMSLYVLLGVGAAPLSNALAGLLLGLSVPGTFALAGIVLIGAALAGWRSRPLRGMALAQGNMPETA